MPMNEFFPSPDFDDSERRRDSYQAQTSGGSVDYDFDKVQVQDVDSDANDVNDKQTKKKVDNNDGDDKKRSVKIDLTQKTGALPDGTSNASL